MDVIPIDIIENEIFPKLDFSDVLNLASIYPEWLSMANKHIVNIGKSIGFEEMYDMNDVFSKLEYIGDMESEFDKIKSEMTIVLHLVSIVNEESLSDFQNKIYPQLDSYYFVFKQDMMNNLDFVLDKKIFRPHLYKYIQKNVPLLYTKDDEHVDFRVFHELFPNFEKIIDKIVIDYLEQYNLQINRLVLDFFKTELNKKLYTHLCFKQFYLDIIKHNVRILKMK
jgi:hypothetical protein